MVTENNEVFDSHDVGTLFHVILPDVLEYFKLDECLFEEVVFVFDDLQCCLTFPLMVINLDDLTEGSPANGLEQLVAVCDVVVEYEPILVILIIELRFHPVLLEVDFVCLVADEVHILVL